MQSLTQQFVSFVQSKPRDEMFRPMIGYECAGFQFLAHLGFPVRICLVTYWKDTSGARHSLPEPIIAAIEWATEQRPAVSFGSLADRLSNA